MLQSYRKKDPLGGSRLVLRPSSFKSSQPSLKLFLIKAFSTISTFFARITSHSAAKWLFKPIEKYLPAQSSRVRWLGKPAKWCKQFKAFFAGIIPSQTARTSWLSRFSSMLGIFGRNTHVRPTLSDKKALLNSNPLLYG